MPDRDPTIPPDLLAAVDTLLEPLAICSAVRDARGEITDFRIDYLNQAAASAAGRPLGSGLQDLFGEEDGRTLADAREVLLTGEPVAFGFDGRLQRLGDGVLVTWRAPEREQELVFLAYHDPLTGLLNRRGLDEEIQRQLDRAARYGTRAVLLVGDLDGFKVINDTFGHSIGDALLIAVGQVLAGRLRRSDVLVRTGGDEFAVVLPQADLDQARQVAEILRAAVDAHHLPIADTTAHVTISIGICDLDARAHASAATALTAADGALYEAKAAGRNQVAIAQ